MDLAGPVEALCARVPAAIGAVLCDFEGETVVTALGAARPPEAAVARAAEHVPRTLALSMPVEEFLVRLAGAEPCALLRLFGSCSAAMRAGALEGLQIRYREVEMLIECLPEDFYLVLVVRRTGLTAAARRQIRHAAAELNRHLV